MKDSKPGQDEPNVPMAEMVKFIRQLSHDLRNHLNAAELQSAYINEISEEAEVKAELKRLREILTEMAASLQRITSKLSPVNLTPMIYEATSFVEDLRQKVAGQFPDESKIIDWELKAESANLEIDPQILQEAFLELFANAFQHERGADRLRATAIVEADEFIFTLQEPKASAPAALENWGREPFRHMSRGHYGLGLHRARHIIETHGGRLDVSYDSALLVTTIALPVASK